MGNLKPGNHIVIEAFQNEDCTEMGWRPVKLRT